MSYSPQAYGNPYGPVATTYAYRSSTAHIVIAWIVAVFTLAYMLPWAIAATRHRQNTAMIALLNLFLGWSLVGWIVALVLALSSDPVPTTVIVTPAYQQPHPQQVHPQPPDPPHQQLPHQQLPYQQQLYPQQPYQQQPYPLLHHPQSPTEPTAILPPAQPDPWRQRDGDR